MTAIVTIATSGCSSRGCSASSSIRRRPDGFDDAKQGVVDSFQVGPAVDGNPQVSQLLLKPLCSGFAATGAVLALNTRKALQDAGKAVFFNRAQLQLLTVPHQLAQPTFCPGH